MQSRQQLQSYKEIGSFRSADYSQGLYLDPFYGRDLVAAGYVVTPSASVRSAALYEQTIQRMIASVKLFSGLSPSGNRTRTCCLNIPEKALFDESIRAVLKEGAVQLARLGFSLAVVGEAKAQPSYPLIDALLDLRDSKVAIHVKMLKGSSPRFVKALLQRHLIDVLHVPAELLGFNQSERKLDHAKLMEASTQIREWMHRYGCRLLLCEIDTAWQAEAAQGMPAFYYQGSFFCEPGIY